MLVLKEQHWIIVTDCGLQKPFGVIGIRRNDHFQPRNVIEERLDALRMIETAADARAKRGPDYQWADVLSVGAISDLRGFVYDLVECRMNVVRELDLGYRP